MLFKWCSRPENREVVEFCSQPYDLSYAIKQDNCKNMRTRREKIQMCGRYYDIKTLQYFRSTWCSFIQESIDYSSNPILYEYITLVFNGIIVQVTSISSIKSCHDDHQLNVIRCKGRYVCKKTSKKFQSSIKILSQMKQRLGNQVNGSQSLTGRPSCSN